jgi:hypothetical protein
MRYEEFEKYKKEHNVPPVTLDDIPDPLAPIRKHLEKIENDQK